MTSRCSQPNAKWAHLHFLDPGVRVDREPSAPDITTNSNSRGQGINRVFKSKDSLAPPAGLKVMCLGNVLPEGTQMLGPVLCET